MRRNVKFVQTFSKRIEEETNFGLSFCLVPLRKSLSTPLMRKPDDKENFHFHFLSAESKEIKSRLKNQTILRRRKKPRLGTNNEKSLWLSQETRRLLNVEKWSRNDQDELLLCSTEFCFSSSRTVRRDRQTAFNRQEICSSLNAERIGPAQLDDKTDQKSSFGPKNKENIFSTKSQETMKFPLIQNYLRTEDKRIVSG